jgi:hypothetical protein
VTIATSAAWYVISASVKARPRTGPTPRVEKNSGVTRVTYSRSVDPVSPTMAASSLYRARLAIAAIWPRRS